MIRGVGIVTRRGGVGMRQLSTAAKQKVTYRSTRGGQTGLSFEEAVLQGLATDRGLLVPDHIPRFTAAQLEAWRGASFQELSHDIISMYVGEDEIPSANLRKIVDASYATFRAAEVTPVVPLGDNMYALELFHGPTFAFKDVALQFLGNLFEYFLERGRHRTHLTVVGATSGDTGSSAIHGLRGKKGVECFIMYPEGRTSKIQELQMISVTDPNIHNIALDGTFDDCQRIVKELFADQSFRTDQSLGAVNSINWARILAQTVYYVYAYLQVTSATGSATPVNFSVPTGNFGDILAGYYAKSMGLPIGDLIVATNANDILHRFWEKGDYSSSDVTQTLTPSMDIQISSNFERFLFHQTGDNATELAAMMQRVDSGSPLLPSAALLASCRSHMRSYRATDDEVVSTIAAVHAECDGYLLDPHTAIGVAAAKALQSDARWPLVCLACAHWAKFGDAVSRAVPTLPALPEELASLHTLPTRVASLPNSTEAIKDFVVSKVAK